MYDFTDMIKKYVQTNLSPVIKLSSGAYVTCEQFKPWQQDSTKGLEFYRMDLIEAVCNIEGTYSSTMMYDDATETWDYIDLPPVS